MKVITSASQHAPYSVSDGLPPTMPTFRTPAFEGPLDLLLHLIRANEGEIENIPIALITTQYLEYIAQFRELDLTIAGEYLVLAATLIEIKSRMLLPAPPPRDGNDEETEDPRAELIAQLREYQSFKETVETLREWEEWRRQLYFRGAAENIDDYMLPVPEGSANVRQLYDALHRLLTEEMRMVSVRTAGLEIGPALLRPGAGLMEELTRIAMAAQRLPSDDIFL